MRHESTLTANQSRLLCAGIIVLAVVLVLGLAPGARADVLFLDIGAGQFHTCAVKGSNELACWGSNSAGQANPPAGTFDRVSAGGAHTCAKKLRPDPNDPEDRTVACWGTNSSGQASPPSVRFHAISAGLSHTCGVQLDPIPGGPKDFTAVCWGDNTSGQATPPAGQFSSVSAGGGHTCGVVVPGSSAACWGDNTFGQATPPAGQFTSVGAGRRHTCGVKADFSVVCWGDNTFGQATPPSTEQLIPDVGGLSGGEGHTCGVRAFKNLVDCWGNNALGQASPPSSGPVFKVSAGGSHTCALTTGFRAICWGDNSDGQATPPGDRPLLVNIVVHGCSPCREGDVARFSLDFSNPGPERRVEVLAVTHFPDGVTMQRFLDEDLEVSLPPGESALDLSPITIPSGLSVGTYFVEAALLHPIHGLTLGRHSVPVQLVP